MKNSRRRGTPKGAIRASRLKQAIRRTTVDPLGRAARDLSEQAATRSHTMAMTSVVGRRGTRKRALPVIGLGFAGLAGMFSLVSANVLAVNFTTANNEFSLYSNYLDASQAAAFLAPTTQQSGSQTGVAELGINNAKLSGLCGIATQDFGGLLGKWSLMITAGDPVGKAATFTGTSVPAGVSTDATTGQLTGSSLSNAITANSLFINSDSLSGYGNRISGLNLGQSAETVGGSANLPTSTSTDAQGWPKDNGGTTPTAGQFGLYAKQLNVAGLSGKSYGLNLAGAITLPKLSLKLVSGAKTQDDCSA